MTGNASGPVEGAVQSSADFVKTVTTPADDALLSFVYDDDDRVTQHAPIVVDFSAALAKATGPIAEVARVASILKPLSGADQDYITKIRNDLAAAAQKSVERGATPAAAAAAQSAVANKAVAALPANVDPAVRAMLEKLQTDLASGQARIAQLEQDKATVIKEKRDETRRRQLADFRAATADPRYYVPADMQDLAFREMQATRKKMVAEGKNPRLGEVLDQVKATRPSLFGTAPAIVATSSEPTARQIQPKAAPKTPSGATEPAVTRTAKKQTAAPKTLSDCAANMTRAGRSIVGDD